MRLYFTEFAGSAKAGVRPLQIVAVAGAVLVAAMLRVLCDTPFGNAAAWCVLIALSEIGIVVVNYLFLTLRPSDQDLPKWANAKTAIAGAAALAVSSGQILLHVEGEPLTAIVPSWGILLYCCGAVWAGAFYVPALYTMILSAILPAAIWLLAQSGLEGATGLCLVFAAPFCMLIGRQASMRYRAAINDKLEVAYLLSRQSAYIQHIQHLSEERNRFFSAASHDLRQPLHAMGLYISLLRDAAQQQERGELIDSLAHCAQSLDTQFNAILGVNETDELLEQARPVPTPLQAVFDRVAAQARPKATNPAVRLRFLRTRAWATIAPDILERVLANLVTNALRYTNSGGVLIGVRRRRGRVAIHVVDTGVGIAPEHQEAVFQDFFQIANPERNPERGFGLGLGIVKRLCAGMNWPIEMKSELGRGAAFIISVPSASAPAVSPRRPAAPVTEPAGSALRTRHTLVVEDDPQVLDAMRRILARWEVDARFCATSEEALLILDESDPSTNWHVLIDYRLPGETDGLALAEKVRRAYGDRAQPAIITGEADEKFEKRAAASGVVVLRKPLQPVRLRALLAR
jgi:two-component system, sensor histidine kinase